MRIELAVRRRRNVSLTSLIDIIFLLLLFFMLSSTFTRFAEVEISGGRAVAGAQVETPDILMRLDEKGWSVNGGPAVPGREAMAELRRLEEEVGAATLVILARGEATSQMLIEAVERIRGQSKLQVSVAR
ncbi:biopolymer transporter ExbD [Chelativorans sp. Marseille-P2723]|uniref:biopolymer transporter ExbD n=1 Tax=Chelativorans sp. Marseille-P2723 TaxID=2709133 RepID=UPI00156E2B87|nr:biopolymer transporter ExbD [Chelativorans sp. Marseille-P2723]